MNETYIAALILSRAEGRTDCPVWPVGETRVFTEARQVEPTLRAIAQGIDLGYDKFDMEIVHSDGTRTQARLDVTKNFSTIGEEFPTLRNRI